MFKSMVGTLLMVAAEQGHSQICEWLLPLALPSLLSVEKGQSPEEVPEEKAWATGGGLRKVCQLLLNTGALPRAAKRGDLTTCQVLLAHGAQAGGVHGSLPLWEGAYIPLDAAQGFRQHREDCSVKSCLSEGRQAEDPTGLFQSLCHGLKAAVAAAGQPDVAKCVDPWEVKE